MAVPFSCKEDAQNYPCHLDPKIPTLSTGTCRVCSVLTLFLDMLPGTSRNGVPAMTNQDPPVIWCGSIHLGRDYYFWEALGKKKIMLPSVFKAEMSGKN